MRRPSAVTAALVLAALLTPLWNLATNTVRIPDSWALWVWVVTVSLAIAACLIEMHNQSGGPAALVGGGIGLDEVANQLATAVGAQWRREEERRRVHHPFTLPVSWHNAPEALMDHPANVHRPPPRPFPNRWISPASWTGSSRYTS